MKVTGVALAALVLAVTSLYAEPSPQPLQPITTQDQVSALRPGSTVVMTCAKCKTVQIAKVDQKKGILGWFQPKTKHLCPGCGGKIKVTQLRVRLLVLRDTSTHAQSAEARAPSAAARPA